MDLSERIIAEAKYLLENGATVRETAVNFSVSKSTIHTDVTRRLKKIDLLLYVEVRKLLDYHFSVRHLRGGESTKNKYLNDNGRAIGE